MLIFDNSKGSEFDLNFDQTQPKNIAWNHQKSEFRASEIAKNDSFRGSKIPQNWFHVKIQETSAEIF